MSKLQLFMQVMQNRSGAVSKAGENLAQFTTSVLTKGDIDELQKAGKIMSSKNLSADFVQLKELEPAVAKVVKASQLEIKKLGLIVDEEAKNIAQQSIEISNKYALCLKSKGSVSERMNIINERGKLYDKIDASGYDYIEGHTPIKLSMQSNETLLKIAEKYKPSGGTVSVYDMACQILAERGIVIH